MKSLGVSGKEHALSLLWDFIYAIAFWNTPSPQLGTHTSFITCVIARPSPAPLTSLSGALAAEVGVTVLGSPGLWAYSPLTPNTMGCKKTLKIVTAVYLGLTSSRDYTKCFRDIMPSK